MHRRGVWHGDLKACNVMLDASSPGAPAFRLLDHDRVVFGSPVLPRFRLRNLVQLNTTLPRAVPTRWRARFLRGYLDAAPAPGGFKALWREVAGQSRGRSIMYVSDGGDVIEEPFS